MSAFDGRFLLGVNYWSRGAGPRMWERFDEARVAAELRQMRAIGLDCCRMFAFAPSMMPSPPAVDHAAFGRMRRFVSLAAEAGVSLLPTALVGHMSGENFDFPGGNRALFTDGQMLEWQRILTEALVDACKDGPVLGWVLSNEMPLWADAAPPEAVAAWCQMLTERIRAKDARPIGVGDGNMSGWPTRKLAPLADWLAPHVYYGDADPMRQALKTDLSLQLLGPLGKPLLLEEFGCSATQAGEAEQAAYWRESIVAALALGARGAIGWCWSDFAPQLGDEPPYSHHGFEMQFGVTRANGSEKPVCDELRAIRRLVDSLDLASDYAAGARVALLVPAYADEPVPFSWEDRGMLQRTLLQSYVLACQAGLDPAVVSEDDDLSGYRLILCPATQKLKTPTWRRLQAAARAGATVYWSYFSGDYNFHQGMWCPDFSELTGLRHRLRYGCFDLPPERFRLRGAVTLDIPTSLTRVAEPYPLSRLPIELRPDAPVRVLATDGEGAPALTAHELGEGEVIFLAWPLERYLALLADGSARDAHRLYRLLGESAGVEPRYPTRHPALHSRVLEDGADDLVDRAASRLDRGRRRRDRSAARGRADVRPRHARRRARRKRRAHLPRARRQMISRVRGRQMISAPSRASSWAKPGKLVATLSVSKMRVSPASGSAHTAPAMAMRWSPWLSTTPAARARPPTISPSARSSASAPSARNIATVAVLRSDSFTRSSAASRMTVGPSACAASAANSGSSSMARTDISPAISMPWSDAALAVRSATGSPPRSR